MPPLLQPDDPMATEVQRIERLLRSQELVVQEAFGNFIRRVRSESFLRRIRERLEVSDIDGAFAILDTAVFRFASILPEIFTRVGAAEVAHLRTLMGRAAVALEFNPAHLRAAALMEESRLALITAITEEQRLLVGSALTSALRTGEGALSAARAFRDAIGLTAQQQAAVVSYEDSLTTGSRDALDRAVRDRRFDRTVETAIANKDPLSEQQIDRMVGAYETRMLGLRAETISRTETQRVLNQARDESLRQSIEQLGFEPSRVKRIWLATHDHRTRDTHAEMDGQVRGLDEPFESPSGALLMYPGDPDAPPEEVINCRCVLDTAIS